MFVNNDSLDITSSYESLLWYNLRHESILKRNKKDGKVEGPCISPESGFCFTSIVIKYHAHVHRVNKFSFKSSAQLQQHPSQRSLIPYSSPTVASKSLRSGFTL